MKGYQNLKTLKEKKSYVPSSDHGLQPNMLDHCWPPKNVHFAGKLATIQGNFTAPDVYIHLNQSKCVLF